MSGRPLVSVIIPTRNRAALLVRALDSVFSQWGIGKEFDLDVIVVDDASTDSTAAVVREYAQAHLLRLSINRGLPVARNVGIEASRGAFICFLDDDDIWLPGRLRLQIPVLERHSEAGAVYSQVFNTYTGKPFPESSRAVSGWIFEALLSGNLMCVHSVLIRNEALRKTGYFDENLSSHEDWDLWLRLGFQFPFVFAPGLVAVYLVSPRGIWQSGVGAKENSARVIAKALQLLPDSPRYAGLKRTVRARTELEYSSTWAEVLVALRRYPFIVRHSWARHRVGRWMYRSALKSESPVLALQELCAQMKEATTSDPRVRHRWRIRQTAAKSWAGMASSLAANPAQQRDAAYAAARATTLAPSLLFQGALAPIIVRGGFAICAESARSSEMTRFGNRRS